MMPMTATGILIPKHHLHDLLVRNPPMTGPMAYETPAKNEKMLTFFEYSFKDTLSAKMTLSTTLMPAQPMPWIARPRISTGKASVGADVQSALPTIISASDISIA